MYQPSLEAFFLCLELLGGYMIHLSESQAMTNLMEGLGELVAEEATKLLTKENISEVGRQFSEVGRQFFANSNISVNILASVFGAAILFGIFLLCE